jgi:hypothetical protein
MRFGVAESLYVPRLFRSDRFVIAILSEPTHFVPGQPGPGIRRDRDGSEGGASKYAGTFIIALAVILIICYTVGGNHAIQSNRYGAHRIFHPNRNSSSIILPLLISIFDAYACATTSDLMLSMVSVYAFHWDLQGFFFALYPGRL